MIVIQLRQTTLQQAQESDVITVIEVVFPFMSRSSDYVFSILLLDDTFITLKVEQALKLIAILLTALVSSMSGIEFHQQRALVFLFK